MICWLTFLRIGGSLLPNVQRHCLIQQAELNPDQNHQIDHRHDHDRKNYITRLSEIPHEKIYYFGKFRNSQFRVLKIPVPKKKFQNPFNPIYWNYWIRHVLWITFYRIFDNMPKVRTKRKRLPKGFEVLKETLDALESKMREGRFLLFWFSCCALSSGCTWTHFRPQCPHRVLSLLLPPRVFLLLACLFHTQSSFNNALESYESYKRRTLWYSSSIHFYTFSW